MRGNCGRIEEKKQKKYCCLPQKKRRGKRTSIKPAPNLLAHTLARTRKTIVPDHNQLRCPVARVLYVKLIAVNQRALYANRHSVFHTRHAMKKKYHLPYCT
jgi:hypothetical protein